jgi:ParB family chromosome partitioning protein
VTRRATARELPGRGRSTSAPQEGSSVADPFGAAPGWADGARLRELPLDALRPNPDQPRKRFDNGGLRALAASLRERGLLQPVLVRPAGADTYELIAGERRWRAARMAGLDRLPAFIREDTDDASALELALIENAAREDLTPVEEARTLSTLINDLGLTQAVLAERIGRSRSDLANTLRLLDLPEDVQDLLDTGRLSKGHGKSLLREPDAQRRSGFAREAVENSWSVRELERAIETKPRNAPPRRPTATGDRETAEALAERLTQALGCGVKVRPRAPGFTIELVTQSREAAESIVERLTARD